MERVVALVDMDCFYVQVEQRLDPTLRGKPCAVVQYNGWKGGGIIAVGYEARKYGVTRNMRGNEAKQKCPDVELVRVPEVRGKADLTKYREAGAQVIDALSRFSRFVERASIDEAYIDLSEEVEVRLNSSTVTAAQLPNTFVVGWESKDSSSEIVPDKDTREQDLHAWLHHCSESLCDQDRKLAIGAVIVEEMRAAVTEQTGFQCSAGVASNKMLAKLVCGFHKPNKQTVLPHESVEELFRTVLVNKVRNFGGKLGVLLQEQLGVQYMGDICSFSKKRLQDVCGGKTGSWLFDVCRGIDTEPVLSRHLPMSIGCSKNFRGRNCLDTREKVRHWLTLLSEEVAQRLQEDKQSNKRVAQLLIVGIHQHGNQAAASRSCRILGYDAKKFAADTFALLQKFNKAPPMQEAWSPAAVNLSLSASKFVDVQNITTNISELLSRQTSGASKVQHTPADTQSQLFVKKDASEKKAKGCKKLCIDKYFQQSVMQSYQAFPNSENFAVVHQDHNPAKRCKDSEKKAEHVGGFFSKKWHHLGLSKGYTPPTESAGTNEEAEREFGCITPDTKPASFPEASSTYIPEKTDETLVYHQAQDDFGNGFPQPSLNAVATFSTSEVGDKHFPKNVHPESTQRVLCDRCGEVVQARDQQEHRDFHFAFELQERINKPVPKMDYSFTMDPERKNQQVFIAQGKKKSRLGKMQKKKFKSHNGLGTLERFFAKKKV